MTATLGAPTTALTGAAVVPPVRWLEDQGQEFFPGRAVGSYTNQHRLIRCSQEEKKKKGKILFFQLNYYYEFYNHIYPQAPF